MYKATITSSRWEWPRTHTAVGTKLACTADELGDIFSRVRKERKPFNPKWKYFQYA